MKKEGSRFEPNDKNDQISGTTKTRKKFNFEGQ
jgi:hypothetical protein